MEILHHEGLTSWVSENLGGWKDAWIALTSILNSPLRANYMFWEKMCLVCDYGKNMVISDADMLCFHGNRWSRQNSKIKQIWVSLFNLLCNILNPSYSIALISSVNFTNEPFVVPFSSFMHCSSEEFLINWRQWYLQNRTYIFLYQSLNTVPKALLLNPNINKMM